MPDNEEGEIKVEELITVQHEEVVSHFSQPLKWTTENDMSWLQILLLQRLREETVKKFLLKSQQFDFFKKD